MKRVGRLQSGVFATCEYCVTADFRSGVWHRENEIVRPVKRQAWTVSIRQSYRLDGKAMKRSAYLFSVSFYNIVDRYERSMLEGREFDFFSSPIQVPANAKFPIDPAQVTGLVRCKFGPVVDKVVREFLGTDEYKCFARYVSLKWEVDAKIKALHEEDEKRAEKERARNTGDADNSRGPVSSRDDRTRVVAQEMAGKFARAVKKKFHPDRTRPVPTTEAEKHKAHEKSIIAQDVANDMMSLMEDYVNYEIDLDPEKEIGISSAGSPDQTDF